MSLDNHKIPSYKKPVLELFVFISEVERFYFNIFLAKAVFYKPHSWIPFWLRDKRKFSFLFGWSRSR